MITNISRLKSLMVCPKKAFNTYHRHLSGPRSLNLVDGSAFHKGVALGQATNDWKQARVDALAQFEVDFSEAGMLPEEDFIKAQHRAIIDKMIEVYEAAWSTQGIQIIQPECEFAVSIPGTEHNDITMHHIELTAPDQTGQWFVEKWGMPSPRAILEGRIKSPHTSSAEDCACWRPHMLVGKTDGIIQWGGNIWLQEHKTTSIAGDQFWQQWHIDMQITGYIYGVWKATGMLPKGVILNAVNKPSEGQVSSWNSRRKHGPPKDIADYISYSREIFLRTEADLEAFELQIIDYCNDWEARILSGRWPMSNIPAHCFNYNRKCDFYGACLSHDDPGEFEMLGMREPDYVDVKRAELVQIDAEQENRTAE